MEDLEIKTCIVCGKQRIPVFALIKKDQSMTFVDKSETVLLELSKENLDYLLKCPPGGAQVPAPCAFLRCKSRNVS